MIEMVDKVFKNQHAAPHIRFEGNYIPVPESGCHLWVGRNVKGYGIFCVGGVNKLAHRYAYEQKNGPIPKGLEIDHLCQVPMCVNPDHMEPVTHNENMARGKPTRTRCKHGHEFTPENTVIRKRKTGKTYRECRECERDRCRKYLHKG
jgi:hypothetical protein